MNLRSADRPVMLVRGISLISMREYVKTKLNGERLEEFFARFPENEVEIILNAERSEWYPFYIQQDIRENVVLEFNPKDPRKAIMDLVAFTADYEISAFLRGIIGILPVHMVLRQSARIFSKFYQPGKMTAVRIGQRTSVFELTDFPADPLFCPVIDAWLTTAGKNMGLKNIEVRETRCIHRGGEVCRWMVFWEQ